MAANDKMMDWQKDKLKKDNLSRRKTAVLNETLKNSFEVFMTKSCFSSRTKLHFRLILKWQLRAINWFDAFFFIFYSVEGKQAEKKTLIKDSRSQVRRKRQKLNCISIKILWQNCFDKIQKYQNFSFFS